MENTFTTGTDRTPYSIPLNEDRCMVMQVVEYSSTNNIITGKKVWDSSASPKLFYAWNKNNGQVFTGQYVLFYRVGEQNQNPFDEPTEFALRDVNIKKISWLALAAFPIILIRSDAEGLGNEVIYENGSFQNVAWSVSLPIVSSTSASNFRFQVLPFEDGRVYFGQKIGNQYVAFTEGMGEKAYQLGFIVSNETHQYGCNLDLTADGRVIDFQADATALIDDPTVYEDSLSVVRRYYDGNDSYLNAFSPPYADWPYVAFVPTSGKEYGFRTGGQYIIAWQYDTSTTDGELPTPFNNGGDSKAYAVTVAYKETATYPDGIIYADRTTNNWKQWNFLTNVWGPMTQSLIDGRAMDYRSDETPVAIRSGNISSISLVFP